MSPFLIFSVPACISQVADGVLTNDSDAFLYGATTVYRDLHTTERVC